MNRLLGALLLSTALTACGGDEADDTAAATPAAEPAMTADADDTVSEADMAAETERLEAWFEEKYEESLQFSPIQLTILGRKDRYGEFDDFSEEAEDRQLEWRRETVAELEENFDYDALTRDAQLSYDIWTKQLEQAEAALPYRAHGYVYTQRGGPHTQLPQFMINFHRVATEQDMLDYLSRLAEIPRVMDQALERATESAAMGIRAPRFAFDSAAENAGNVITGAPFDDSGTDSPFLADVKAKAASLVEAGTIDQARGDELVEMATQILTADIRPAYDRTIEWLEAEAENADVDAKGVWNLPDGTNYYKERLAYSTTTDMTADEIHELGLAEVERLRGEMEAIKDEVGFEGTLEEFFVFVRDDPQFYYPNTDEGREQYLQGARDALAFIETRLPDYFGILPKAGLVVKRVEAFREEDGGAQHYNPGTPDGSRPGIYYNHLSDMAAMPIPQLEVIAYHEGSPGHHMQISIQQELENIPMFRTQAFFGAYVEGWALYSELLALEMGAYEDPYSNFGRLTTEIWRAIRLVVDTGLHEQQWSEEEAVQYFMANSPAAEGQIRSEIRRYLTMPGQATSYKIGMIQIQDLRARAERELGDDFDIRAFHDLVLGSGALPLDMLERQVDGWIADQKAA